MLSRVADAIFWMARYVERAENVARFINVNLHLNLDMPAGSREQWVPLVMASGDQEAFEKRHKTATRRNVIDFLTFDSENPNSITSCVTAARENARSVREVISAEMWEHLNEEYLSVKSGFGLDDALRDPHDYFNAIRIAGQQFIGITDATMTHGEGWNFARLGRLIERADKTSRILDVKYYTLLPQLSDVGTPFDDIQWGSLLRSASGFEMYRQKYGTIEPESVVEFLILDKQFPRAALFCLTKANDSMHLISGTPTGGYSNRGERMMGQLRSDLAYRNAKEIVSEGLHEFVDRLQTRLNDVGDAIIDTFFSLRPVDTGSIMTSGYGAMNA